MVARGMQQEQFPVGCIVRCKVPAPVWWRLACPGLLPHHTILVLLLGMLLASVVHRTTGASQVKRHESRKARVESSRVEKA